MPVERQTIFLSISDIPTIFFKQVIFLEMKWLVKRKTRQPCLSIRFCRLILLQSDLTIEEGKYQFPKEVISKTLHALYLNWVSNHVSTPTLEYKLYYH